MCSSDLVVSEKVLQSAWSQVCALPADALVVPRRKSNPGCRLTEAVRYAVQSSAVDGAAAAIRKKPKQTHISGCSRGRSDLDTLAHAAALADRVADSVTLLSPAPTEPSTGLPLHQIDPVRKEHDGFEREDLLSNSQDSPGQESLRYSPAEQLH